MDQRLDARSGGGYDAHERAGGPVFGTFFRRARAAIGKAARPVLRKVARIVGRVVGR